MEGCLSCLQFGLELKASDQVWAGTVPTVHEGGGLPAVYAQEWLTLLRHSPWLCFVVLIQKRWILASEITATGWTHRQRIFKQLTCILFKMLFFTVTVKNKQTNKKKCFYASLLFQSGHSTSSTSQAMFSISPKQKSSPVALLCPCDKSVCIVGQLTFEFRMIVCSLWKQEIFFVKIVPNAENCVRKKNNLRMKQVYGVPFERNSERVK